MKTVLSVALNVVLNVVVLLLAPLLVLVWLARVHTIEYLQSQRLRMDQLGGKAAGHWSEVGQWSPLSGRAR
jgi:hypothetical protein